MKASKQAPEQRYRYRLYTTERVTCGPEVAEFITEHSEGVIQIEPVGEVSFTQELIRPLRKEYAEHAFRGEMFGEGPYVVLTNADLVEPIFWYNQHSVLSRMGLKIGRVAGADVPIYAYLTLLAIVGHELSSSDPAGFLMNAVSAPSPFDWEVLIKSGKLPGDLHEMLNAAETRIGLEFNRGVDRALKAIALNSSDIRAVPSSVPDPRQHPPHKKPKGQTETVDITSDPEIRGKEPAPPETETATTGFRGAWGPVRVDSGNNRGA